MTRPLVSVITPTWKRPDDLAVAIETVRAQGYRPIEHVIVADGPDDVRTRELVWDQRQQALIRGWTRIVYVELGRNWSTFLPDSFCAAPTTVAMLVASGDYQCWLADDERMTPDHVESLVDAIEASGADFAYSKVEMYRAERPGDRWVIGADPPRLGQITNALYRADVLKLGLFPFGAGMVADWACISRWQSGGARHAFVDRVTLTHRADH